MKQPQPPREPRWRDEDQHNRAARGLDALARTAAGRVDLGAIEHELGEIVRDRRQMSEPPPLPPAPQLEAYRPPAQPFILPGPLSEEAKTLVSKSVLMGKDKMTEGARAAADAYLRDAQALVEAVENWCAVLETQTQEMVELLARHHDSLLKAKAIFERTMNGDLRPETPDVAELPNREPSNDAT